MAKLILLSVIIAPVAIPIWAAREKSSQKAFKKTLFYFIAFNFAYIIALRFLFLRLI